MKKADTKSLKTKSSQDLAKLVENVRKEIKKLELERYTEGHTHTHEIGAKKKELARILTIISEKRIIQSLEKEDK